MKVRHLVAADNVDADGFVIDVLAVRHGTLRAARVHALAGPIDPLTHLNLDFGDHMCDVCVVVLELELGAAVLLEGGAFAQAQVARGGLARRGRVDVGERRLAWLMAFEGGARSRAASAVSKPAIPPTR